MEKVYIILKYDLESFESSVYKVYKDKRKAQKEVDNLNDSVIDNENVDYRLQSYPIEDIDSD